MICQSCGMPMKQSGHFGTNKDGSSNNEYCIHCFKDGRFTSDVTMDEMIEVCVKHLEEFNRENNYNFTRESALFEMKKFFPTLKRWK